MGKLFGTDGIRGVVNAGLDADLAYKVGLAAAEVLAKGKQPGEKPLVTIGKDTRISGDLLKGSLIAGLCTAGADVLDLGTLPTPGVAWVTGDEGADAGIVISASHNPFEHNGIKIFNGQGFKLSDELEEKIEEIVYRSLVMKKNVVERDEREAGLRATLNFGHTLGHAIESANHLGGLYHGECVALGMLPMIEDASLRRRTRAVYKKLGLPSRIRYDGDEIFEFIRHDKKTGPDGAITVVKVPRLGECRLDKVPLEDLKAIIGEGVR